MNFKSRLYLFWKIGECVFKKQNCFDNVVSKYSNLLIYKFGMSDTFSIKNINYMKKFYCSFPIYFKDLDTLSFEHYKLLVDINEKSERYFYFRVALFCRSNILELQELINEEVYYFI